MNLFYLDKQNHKQKWHLVLFTSFGLFGSAYSLIIPPTFQNQQILTSLHYLLNSILPYFSALFRDYYGDQNAILLQNILCLLGQLIVTFSIKYSYEITFIIGRFILGWGIESLLIMLTSFICSYYKYTFLTFVLGFYQLIYMTGLVISNWYINDDSNFIALLLTILGLIMAIVSRDIDATIQSKILKTEPKYFEIEAGIKKSSQLYEKQGPSEILFDDGEEIIIEQQQQDYVEPQVIKSEVVEQPFYTNYFGYGRKSEFPQIYWLLVFYYTFASTSVLVLAGYAQEFLQKKWLQDLDDGAELAQKLVMIMWLFSGFITPLLGIVIDLYGHRSTLTILSGIMAIWAHLLVLFQSPFEGLLLLAFSFALSYTTIWSGVLYLTHPHNYGKSLALLVCLQNFGIFLTPYICKFLERFSESKTITETFLLILAIVSTIAAVLVYNEDNKYVNLIDRGLQVVSEQSSEKLDSKKSK